MDKAVRLAAQAPMHVPKQRRAVASAEEIEEYARIQCHSWIPPTTVEKQANFDKAMIQYKSN